MRTGLFGGTFDPIHVGHLIQAQAMLEIGPLDRILFVPAGQPPHKGGVVEATAADRLEMVRRAIAAHPDLGVSEREIRDPTTSYTIRTLEAFRAAQPDEEHLWIIGADTVCNLPSWKEIDRFFELGDVLIASRAGHSPEEVDRLPFDPSVRARLRRAYRATPIVEVSSSEIRRRAAEGLSIEFFVPPDVARYIAEKGLYRR